MPASVDILLRSAIDYAGTFPPASLDLADAMAGYGRAATGPRADMLGRFVLPVSRLEEFARLVSRFTQAGQTRWPLSLVVSGAASELDQAVRFQTKWPGHGEIRALEFGPHHASAIAALVETIPRGVDAFFELPIDANLEAGIEAVARHAALAKVRTGGTVATAVPSADDLVRFMRGCAATGIAFKATAGLHHALRGSHALTYDPASPRAEMFGFLNVAVAAALLHGGASSEDAAAALRECSAGAFAFTDVGLEWCGRAMTAEALADTRRLLFRSFGSCAFDEPIAELEALRLI
jgi:hypothetical protein